MIELPSSPNTLIHRRNEITHNKPELTQFLRNRRVRIEPSAPYQDQNDTAERLGAMIKDRARAMRMTISYILFI